MTFFGRLPRNVGFTTRNQILIRQNFLRHFIFKIYRGKSVPTVAFSNIGPYQKHIRPIPPFSTEVRSIFTEASLQWKKIYRRSCLGCLKCSYGAV